MADQGKWWKLWISSLRDDDLENLSIHEWFGWVRFGAHMKEHGKDGKIRLRSPATSVVNLMRVPNFEEAVNMIKRFPNYVVEEAPGEASNVTVRDRFIQNRTVSVKAKNWNKYQGDYSVSRVRKHRLLTKLNATVNVTAQEEKRREEKRKEEIPPIAPQGGPPLKVLEWFEKTWSAYPKESRVGKQAALRSYKKRVKSLDDAIWIGRALDEYLKSRKVQDGYIKNASTFFANVEDYADERKREASPIHESVADFASSAKPVSDHHV